jgi:hypothetical protein
MSAARLLAPAGVPVGAAQRPPAGGKLPLPPSPKWHRCAIEHVDLLVRHRKHPRLDLLEELDQRLRHEFRLFLLHEVAAVLDFDQPKVTGFGRYRCF